MPTLSSEKTVRVIGICGSLTENSSTRKSLQVALRGASNEGASTELVDLRDYVLPFAGSGWSPETYPDVARLNGLVRAADAIIWATPEYHGSFSGVLKNALDLGGFEEYQGKMIALVGAAGGSIGAINALGHLRTVARQLHAWVLPAQVSVARSSHAFDTSGELIDAKLKQSLLQLGAELALFAKLHASAKN